MPHRDKTRLVRTARGHIGVDPCSVNPPIVRTSTVLCKDTATLTSVERRRAKGERIFSYAGRPQAQTGDIPDTSDRQHF